MEDCPAGRRSLVESVDSDGAAARPELAKGDYERPRLA
jgi:hypothetical protein